ncbi:hypothetical protein CDAR_13291 [Caerostris darwini]|uniref:Uncharacterized protein n=1 Tax=Caerostris darwini TaxID=1538125 RepID=A0AAV4R5I5_9ARAC|nr:hypothetical protein CDAR_13291 [Caerostris darwini]
MLTLTKPKISIIFKKSHSAEDAIIIPSPNCHRHASAAGFEPLEPASCFSVQINFRSVVILHSIPNHLHNKRHSRVMRGMIVCDGAPQNITLPFLPRVFPLLCLRNRITPQPRRG